MKFRPCIDIHNGKVKQIVGSSLTDENSYADENFVAEKDSEWFARLFKADGLKGGHVIMLNNQTSPYYEATREQALKALRAYPGGLQAGGGINPDNALDFLRAGASHVIVTSYVFSDGVINHDNLKRISDCTGKNQLILDLSCRKRDGGYYVVTDRWQHFTDEQVSIGLLNELSEYCDGFLVHAVDVEGKNSGIQTELVSLLSGYQGLEMTYAGGVHSMEDLETISRLGKDRIDATVGSALDLYGGSLSYKKIADIYG